MPIPVLIETGPSPEEIRLLTDPAGIYCGEATFAAVLKQLALAEKTVAIHMFVWRSDSVGNAVAAALLAAADRGVKFTVRKDLGAVMYERIEMNRRPLFAVKLPWLTRLYYRLVQTTFPDTYQPDDGDGVLGEQLLAHANGTVEWVNHTHTKYYIFDERTMLTGSINLEARHLGYFDYMVQLDSAALVARFQARLAGATALDEGRDIEFVLNRIDSDGSRHFEIKPQLLAMISAAARTLYVEMAYLGDPDFTAALITAARRGVAVTVLLSRTANVGNDLNYAVARELYAAGKVQIVLSPVMTHAKLLLADGEVACFGSANASVFSLVKAVELNLLVRNRPHFLVALTSMIERRLAQGIPVRSPDQLKHGRAWLAHLQQLHQRLL